MKKARFVNDSRKAFALCACILSGLFFLSCSTNQSKAHELIETYLKDRGAVKVKSDFFYTSANVPGKAYASVTATFNFAGAQGSNQQEFLGFILNQEGEGWKIESPAAYTLDEKKAALYLVGKKK